MIWKVSKAPVGITFVQVPLTALEERLNVGVVLRPIKLSPVKILGRQYQILSEWDEGMNGVKRIDFIEWHAERWHWEAWPKTRDALLFGAVTSFALGWPHRDLRIIGIASNARSPLCSASPTNVLEHWTQSSCRCSVGSLRQSAVFDLIRGILPLISLVSDFLFQRYEMGGKEKSRKS
jgi:hypothetical protein